MTALYAALLGVIQGLTEFLPISSSAHLLLARDVFGWESEAFGLSFDVACHVGTLVAVVVYFRRELTSMLASLPRVFGRQADLPARQLRLITVGTVPIALVGLALGDSITATWRTPGVAAIALAAGAVVLLTAERVGSRLRSEGSLTMMEALGLGVAQATALVPGVSRSGAIIAVAVLIGLKRDAAARFAFLLGVPAILAAAARQGLVLAEQGPSTDGLSLLAIGMVTSAGVGYLTVRYFLRYVAAHPLDVFAFYRLSLAAGVLIWLVAS